MNRVVLKRLQVAQGQLRKQIAVMRQLYEETLQAEQIIKNMDYMDRTKSILIKSRESMEENIRVLTLMAEVLHEAGLEYRKTEARITDRYNLDTVIYPKTRFETSRITGMEEYQSLMPF